MWLNLNRMKEGRSFVCARVYLVASRPGKMRINLGCSCERVAFHNTIFNIWITYGILKVEIFSMLTP